MHKKPRGTPYHFSITVGTGKPPQEMTKMQLHLPTDKASIERHVAAQFAIDARAYDLPDQILSKPIQNEENDIDFTVETNHGAMGLELVEYAPVGKRGFAGPKPSDSSPVERARQVIGLIVKKNTKYRHYKKFQQLMLLIYVTDNAWALDHFTLRTIQFLARTENTTFDFITYYKPMVDTSGIVYRLYPIADSEYEELGQLRIPAECRRIL